MQDIIAEIRLFVIILRYGSATIGINRVLFALTMLLTRRKERKYLSGTFLCKTPDKVHSLSALG